jgi:GNAT superfamily N-acetyltransferase
MLVKYVSGGNYLGLTTFNSGLAPVDDFLRKGSIKEHSKKNYNQTYLFVDPSNQVIAYYTLQAFSLTKEFLSGVIATSLPKQIPVFRISLLGVQLTHQRKGIGSALVGDAVAKTLALQDELGTIGLYLDAEFTAIPLYQKCNFINITPINPHDVTPMFLKVG